MPNRIMLINPQNDFTSFKKFEVLALGYIASSLEAARYDVEIYDCNFRDPRPVAVADAVRSGGFELCGITTMVGATGNAVRVARAIRGRAPNAAVVLGGYSATFEHQRILADTREIDFIIRGEGELAFRALADALFREGGSKGRADVPGLVMRSTGDDIIVNPPMNVVNLDALPFPRRSDHLEAIGLASILSSRGCQALCSFCSIQEFGRLSGSGAIRCRSPENVVDEIASINRSHGIEYFLFIDDNFFGSERFANGRLQAVAQGLIKRNLSSIRFEVSTRSADLRPLELEALAEAGLSRVYIGLEAGSVSQLKRYRKGCTVARNVGAIEAVRERGIGIDFGFIPFDPYLRPEELLASMRFLLDNDLVYPWSLNTITVSVNPFPGTYLHERIKADGLLRQYDDFNYWFEFEDKTYGPRFKNILAYLKNKYIIGIIDRYANGKSQQNFVGPELKALQPALRTMFVLWIERVRAELDGECLKAISARIDAFESALANILSAQLQLNALKASRHEPKTYATLEALACTLAGHLGCFADDTVPGMDQKWRRPFAFERAYHEIRDELEGGTAVSEHAWQLSDGLQGYIPLESVNDSPPGSSCLLDVFVPGDRRVLSEADDLPPTLYFGSVTGKPSLDLIAADYDGQVAARLPLHTGWTEVRLSSMPASIRITSPAPTDALLRLRLRAPLRLAETQRSNLL